MGEHPLGPAARRGPFEQLHHKSVVLAVSEQEYRERIFGPTESERIERERLRAEREAREHAERARYHEARETSRGVLRAVLELHVPVSSLGGSWWTCGSCYDGGNMGDHEDWPCPTARILLGEER